MGSTNHGRVQTFGAALLVFGVAALGMPACGTSAEKSPERVSAQQAAVIPLEPPTTVQSGTPSPRTPKCPGKKLPDQCGTWAGVELHATRSAAFTHGDDNREDEHCLCDAVDFQLPAELAVASGKSGWDWDKAGLSYRTASGRIVECRYRGNASPLGGHFGIPVGGDKYLFERCSDGSKPGQTKTSDWFELELSPLHPGFEGTEVELRFGEPDVVGGVVQEQIFYATDSRIAGAALHVPRGAAPAFEGFSINVLGQVPLRTTIPNANDPATTVGYAVDVHADSTDHFTFTNVPGAPCARLELPYDPAALNAVAGPGAESTIQAQQLTTLTGITSGARVLTSAGPVTVDLTRHTFSFCVEHLSFYVGTSGSFNSDLTTASIRSTGGGSLGPTDLLSGAALPILTPLEGYELTLGFTRVGGTTAWLTGSNLYLVAVGAPSGLPLAVTSLGGASSWGAPVATNVFTGSPVANGGEARFTLSLTAPSTTQPMNYCLRNGTSASTGFFGDCFSWDGVGAASGGTTPVPLAEVCDNVDNDGDGSVDEGVTRDCYSGPPGTENFGQCQSGVSTCSAGAWGPCVGEVLPGLETCGNTVDEDCDGAADSPTLFYFDGDGDGFGDPNITGCTSEPLWVTTAGDCCDSDPNAFPGQTGLFPGPTACGGFDYNCDGAITHFNDFIGAEQSGCPPGVTGGNTICTGCNHDGWPTTVPGCGVTTDFDNCGYGPEPCVASCAIFTNVWVIQQTQTCR